MNFLREHPEIQNKGLESTEAKRRLEVYGPNRLNGGKRAARLREILRTLADPMAVMLFLASGLYFVMGDRQNGFVLLAAVLPVLLVDVVLEFRSHQALKNISQAFAPKARVLRDGAEVDIPTEELVPGDLLVLQEGDKTHADGVLRQSSNFSVDESALTGESEPVAKQHCSISTKPSEESLFFAGSTVLSGQAYGEILATGPKTRFGQIAELVREEGGESTPLQKKTGLIVKRMALIAIVVILLVFLFTLLRGSSIPSSFLSSISLGISIVPEEFPLVLTIFLSLGAWRLSRRGVLIKHLVSVETLGSTTVICVDKTGTLTQGKFVLDSHHPLFSNSTEEEVLEASVLACELSPADPMEKSILSHALEHGVSITAVQDSWELVCDFDFDPLGKHMSHVWMKRDDSTFRIVAKGALEGILEHCDISSDERKRAEIENARLALKGFRVLAVAGRFSQFCSGKREEDETGLKLYGLVAFNDPLRPEVPGAVALCQQAGIRIKIITGDHLLTAQAVADAAGITHRPEDLVNGPDLKKLDPEHFEKRIREGVVFARIDPLQKFTIVEVLKRSGEVVAMTGDGINDAPALKKADIGIAMGVKGTEVARATADMVLLNDSFSSIVDTVADGRKIFNNIQKSFLYLFSFKLPCVGIALLCPLMGVPLLLMPVHLVWLELIQHPISAFVFEAEPPDKDVMRRPPRDPKKALLPRNAFFLSLLSGFFLGVAILGIYIFHLAEGVAYARSVALCVYVIGSLILIWAARAGFNPWWKTVVPRTARIWVVIGISALTLPMIMYTPWLASAFQVVPLKLHDWGFASILALISTAWRMQGMPVSWGRDQSGPAKENHA